MDTSVEEETDVDNENIQIVEPDDDASSDEEGSGWWTNSPTEPTGEHLLSRGNDDTDDFSEQSSDSASWVPEDDDTVDVSNPRGMPPRGDTNSASIQDLLGHDFQSPLLAGMGFQNQSYHGMFQNKNKSSTSKSTSDDDIWEDSGVKIDPSGTKRILYIQMEYCSTTLRKLIDESNIKPLDENDIWRMVRQILEALVYIHGQQIIHRDLVSVGARTLGPTVNGIFSLPPRICQNRNREMYF